MPRPSSGSSWTNARHPTTPVSRPPSRRSRPGVGRRRVHPVAQPASQLLRRRSSGSPRQRTCPSRPIASEWVDPQKNDQGALFSLGVDLAPVGAAAAPFVDSILKGAKPADLPAQEVPKVEFALSLKRAAELGITVPDDVDLAGRPGLSVAAQNAGAHGGNAGTAASAPRLEIRGGRRDAGRGGHRLRRDQRVLVLLRGQQAGRHRGRGGQGVVRRHLDPPVHPGAGRRPRRRGQSDPGRPGRDGSPAVVHEPVPAPAGDQRADVPRCDRRGVRARLLQRDRQDRQPRPARATAPTARSSGARGPSSGTSATSPSSQPTAGRT